MGGIWIRGGLLGASGQPSHLSGAGGQILGGEKRRIQEAWKEAGKCRILINHVSLFVAFLIVFITV